MASLTIATGGANGLPGIPPPDIFNHPLEETVQVTAICVVAMLCGCLVFWLAMRAPFGHRGFGGSGP